MYEAYEMVAQVVPLIPNTNILRCNLHLVSSRCAGRSNEGPGDAVQNRLLIFFRSRLRILWPVLWFGAVRTDHRNSDTGRIFY